MTGASSSLISGGTALFTSSGGGSVTSVFGRTGVITAQTGDYTIAQIGGAGTAAAENLSAIIIDNGAGALTIGASQVTNAMLSGSIASGKLASTAVTVGSYTNTNLTVNAQGQIVAASSGTGGGTPGGSTGDIQFNNAGTFGGETLVPLVNGGSALSNIITTLTTNGTITAMPVASSIIRYASTTGATIEGIAAPSGSQRIILQAAFGSIGVTLKNQNTGATAANRLELQNGQDLSLTAGTQVELFYNTVDSRWQQADFRSPIGVTNGLSTQNIFSNAGGIPTGVSNIVFGNGAVSAGTFNGSNAVILGTNAAKNAGNASDLIAIGNGSAGTGVLTGGENIFIGSSAGLVTTSGSANVFIGGDNGQNNTTGAGNVYVGGSSGLANTTGTQNIGIGFDAGGTNITGNNQIMIGAGTQVQSFTNLSNVVAIGTSVRPTTSDTMLLGGTGSPVNVGINNDTPAYRVDVGGDVNVSGAFRINGVSQTPWTLVGNAGTSPGSNFLGTTDFEDLWIYTNNLLVQKITASGLTGFQQTTPIAAVHAGVLSATVGAPASVFASLTFASSGYSFGSGDKNYAVYGSLVVSGSQIFSSSNAPVTFTEPTTSTFDPSGASASFQTGGGGYTASGYDFTYTIWALYNGQTQISFGNSLSPDTGTDPNDGSNYNVGVSWSAPGGPAPDAYLVQIGGSNPNSGQYQVISGTSFTDSNSGWTSSASYSTLIYTVMVSYSAGAAATSYRVLNTTSGTFMDDTVPSQEVVDDGTWASGSTVTPTVGSYPSLAADGDIGFFLTTPIGQQTGEVGTALVNYGLITSPIYNANSVEYNATAPVFSGDNILYLDGTTFGDMNAHAFTFAAGAGVASSGAGSFNTINIGSPVNPSGAVAGEIFRNSSSGTLSFSDGSVHSILLDSVALSGAGQVTGTLGTTQGGTNLTSYTQGDILYSSATNTLSKLAKNTTASRYLSNTGTSNNPAWAQINLANGVTGTLPIANGGVSLITGDFTAQSAANATVVTVTSPNDGNKHTYRIGAYANITAVATDVLNVQMTYTDENGTSRTQSFFPMGLTSASLATTGAYSFPCTNIRVNPNTAITVATILTTSIGTITYDVGGTIEQLT